MRLCIIFGQGRVCGMIWGKLSGVREGGGAMGEGNGGVVVFDGEGSGMDTPPVFESDSETGSSATKV